MDCALKLVCHATTMLHQADVPSTPCRPPLFVDTYAFGNCTQYVCHAKMQSKPCLWTERQELITEVLQKEFKKPNWNANQHAPPH